MRRDLEDWLRGEANLQPSVESPTKVLELNLLVVPPASSFLPPEAESAPKDRPATETSAESALRDEGPEEKSFIDNKKISSFDDAPAASAESLGAPPPSEDAEEEPEPWESLDIGNPLEAASAANAAQRQDYHRKKNDGNDNDDESGDNPNGGPDIHGKIQGDDNTLQANEFLEYEESRFTEQLRRIEQMRRASSAQNKRIGFYGSRGRFFTSCVVLVLIVGTMFATYRHMQRNAYGTLMEGADEFYKQERYELALEGYQKTAARYPERLQPLLGMAYTAERIGRIEEAIAAYRLGLDRIPAGAAPSRAGVFYEIGRLYSVLKMWEKAQESFEQAVAIDATNYGAHFALGNALEERGKARDALEAYKRALDLSPSSDAAGEAVKRVSLSLLPSQDTERAALEAQKYDKTVQVGTVALGLKRYGEASQYFADALAIRSDDANLWVWFADARNGLKDTAGAIKSLQRALERDPGHADAKAKLSAIEEARGKKASPAKKPDKKNTKRAAPRRSDLLMKKDDRYVLAVPVGGVADNLLSRGELFDAGVSRYREEKYALAFDAFRSCMNSTKKDALASVSLAGEAGPLWKGFNAKLNIPSDAELLAESVRLNPEDRELYLNLSMAGTKMGMERKAMRETLDDIYRHAATRSSGGL